MQLGRRKRSSRSMKDKVCLTMRKQRNFKHVHGEERLSLRQRNLQKYFQCVRLHEYLLRVYGSNYKLSYKHKIRENVRVKYSPWNKFQGFSPKNICEFPFFSKMIPPNSMG